MNVMQISSLSKVLCQKFEVHRNKISFCSISGPAGGLHTFWTLKNFTMENRFLAAVFYFSHPCCRDSGRDWVERKDGRWRFPHIVFVCFLLHMIGACWIEHGRVQKAFLQYFEEKQCVSATLCLDLKVSYSLREREDASVHDLFYTFSGDTAPVSTLLAARL
jgi:hypothetical protein